MTPIRIHDVLRAANTMAGCDLRRRDRHKRVLGIRMAAFAVARDLTGRSYPQIGLVFGRDHTTIMNGCRRADPVLAAAVGLSVLVSTHDLLARMPTEAT